MVYDYETPHIRWQITERSDGVAELYRFIPGDNPPYGGWLEFVSDHDSPAKAETSADDTDWDEFPEPDEPPEPIPLVRDPLPEPLRKVA